MRIVSLSCRDYRNLAPLCFSPKPEGNVLWGQNAQGKTNLLEALWIFTGGRSFRGAKDSELVRHGAAGARLLLSFYSEEREQSAEIRIAGGRRQVLLNGIALHSPGELVGHVYAVIFSPEHLALVRGGPANRRSFMDAALCQMKPGYAGILSRYHRALSQRNALLKDIPRHWELEDTLPIWDARLVQDGERIVSQRKAFLSRLSVFASSVYAGLSHGAESLQIFYHASAPNFADNLQKEHKQDIRQGFTGAGPHRDDMVLQLNDSSARSYASQGQKRSIVLALKLAEAHILEECTGEKPAVLLDDVLSELDSARQDYLLNHLSQYQVFITCCEPQQAMNLHSGGLFRVENGMVTAAGPEKRKGEVYVSSSGTEHGDTK
ncbi:MULTISPECIES: DNA replication/repair protein RecF [Caproicibacterium]|uniref:DNA replication and repair protein RecF n=1 Tax=Caproicibacterium lactatifermentans TaxID=2666138 RepID=A0A859DMQ1_9FIRM|nr:DNA replication/repair protein RecF [Caproicibacterium lactatifermentans]ARP49414.1 DNA replication/repair protein RecF [Ruminococcaceae bacterium CPB6]MDD4807230.1 DNA replication/repair protein RecF [Oscillospiraceae bacterium]QKN23006.1 DNA replication/repair protein RecF [Caproicibacterium lactatifermentans]QKO30388.1 DNA replication/repair protein RecF [Caproicibacterium lactatifermentans]